MPSAAFWSWRIRSLSSVRASWPLSKEVAPLTPTDSLPVVRYDTKAGQRGLDLLRWGLIPYWAKDIKVGFVNINSTRFGSPLVLSRVHWVRPELEFGARAWLDQYAVSRSGAKII
jgi:putative SOS response-associated peptidase YedK